MSEASGVHGASAAQAPAPVGDSGIALGGGSPSTETAPMSVSADAAGLKSAQRNEQARRRECIAVVQRAVDALNECPDVTAVVVVARYFSSPVLSADGEEESVQPILQVYPLAPSDAPLQNGVDVRLGSADVLSECCA